MKAFVFVLTAISMAMALPMTMDILNPGRTSAVAPCALPSRKPAQVVGPCEFQSGAHNYAAGRGAHVGFIVNGGYVPENNTEATDRYLFHLSINEFEAQRNSRHPPNLDWSSDGCTKAPDDIGTWDFLPACHRHDFGLRNYRDQGRLNKTTKRHIDDQFLEDLEFECDTHTITRRFCSRVARRYYDVVKWIDPDIHLV